MNNIYSIKNDGFAYQALDLNLLDIARFAPADIQPDEVMDFSRKNSQLTKWWQAPQTRFVGNEGVEDLGIPDISTWIGATLVLSPKAYRYLGDTLRDSGELLPVFIGNETFYIFNCLTFGQENIEECEYEMLGEIPIQLTKLNFKNSVHSLMTFKSQYEACLTVYCNQNVKCAVDEFKLTGIQFSENLVSN